jgi:hypothetical protein
MEAERTLKYISTENLYMGSIKEVRGGSVVIDLDGRLGQLHLPNRMIIAREELVVGQKVGFLMTYPEVLEAK